MSADGASTSNQRGGTKGKREPNNVVQVTDGDDDATTVKFEALKRRVVGIMGVEAVKRENEDGGVFEAWFQGRCLGTSAGATDEDLWWAIDLRDEEVRPKESEEYPVNRPKVVNDLIRRDTFDAIGVVPRDGGVHGVKMLTAVEVEKLAKGRLPGLPGRDAAATGGGGGDDDQKIVKYASFRHVKNNTYKYLGMSGNLIVASKITQLDGARANRGWGGKKRKR